jgi:hypothetical protein
MIPFSAGWKAFQKFVTVPADSSEDTAAFQVSWLRDNAADPVLEILFGRQLNDEALSVGPLRRMVALQFLFQGAPQTLQETELWSRDFRSMDAFLDAVERDPSFEYGLEGNLMSGDAMLVAED